MKIMAEFDLLDLPPGTYGEIVKNVLDETMVWILGSDVAIHHEEEFGTEKCFRKTPLRELVEAELETAEEEQIIRLRHELQHCLELVSKALEK